MLFTDSCAINLIDRVTDEFTRKREEFLYKQFARHGYSLEQVISLLYKDEIHGQIMGDSRIYMVKDKPLFSITETLNEPYVTGDTYNISITYTCADLSIPVVESEKEE